MRRCCATAYRASKRVVLAEPERWCQREVYTEPVYRKTRGFSSTKPFAAHRRCARAGEASLPVDRRACEGEPDTDIAYSGSTLRRDGETDETGTVTSKARIPGSLSRLCFTETRLLQIRSTL